MVSMVLGLESGGGVDYAAEAAVHASTPQPPRSSGGAPVAHAATAKFMDACAACHTIGGGELVGPDLAGVATWTRADLTRAIKRMEPEAGPMSDGLIEDLTALLQDPNAKARLDAAAVASAKTPAAQPETGSVALGRELFEGVHPLQGKGLACAACHSLDDEPHTLGPSLRTVHAKMGKVGLASAIEKARFKIMAPVYRLHPITRQEALHLAAYLGSIESRPAPPSLAIFWIGAAGTVFFALGMAATRRSGAWTRHAPLQRRRK